MQKEIDLAFKEVFSNKYRFADLLNQQLYDGQQVIRNDMIEEVNPELINICSTNPEDNEISHRIQDLVMKVPFSPDEPEYFMLLGLEEQSTVEYRMPVRMLEYETLRYVKQTKVTNSCGAPRTFTTEDPFAPIVTILVNFSGEPWKGPHSLREMFHHLPPKIAPYVMEYKMNILDPYTQDASQIDNYKTDLKWLFHCYPNADSGDKLQRLVNSHPEYTKLAPDITKLLNATLKLEFKKTEQGENNMCKAIEEIRAAGFDAGQKSGFDAGQKSGFDAGQKSGFDAGQKSGFDAGQKEGIDRTILSFVRYKKSQSFSNEQLCQELVAAFGLSQENARKYLLRPFDR